MGESSGPELSPDTTQEKQRPTMPVRYYRSTLAPNYAGATFPVDMLRYDDCWPSTSEDANAIHMNIAKERRWDPVNDRVTVTHTSKTLTNRRWDSFGWTVVKTVPGP